MHSTDQHLALPLRSALEQLNFECTVHGDAALLRNFWHDASLGVTRHAESYFPGGLSSSTLADLASSCTLLPSSRRPSSPQYCSDSPSRTVTVGPPRPRRARTR